MKAIFLFLVSLPLWADQDCGYRLNVQNAAVTVGETQQLVQQEIAVGRSSNGANCANYRIFFSKGLANSYQRKAFTLNQVGLRSVNYNLHRNLNQAGILKEFGDALTASEYLEGNVPDANANSLAAFYLAVPGFDILSTPVAGSYFDNVQVALYSVQSSGRLSFEEVRTFTLSLLVTKKVALSIVDEGQPFDVNATTKVLDFGFIEKGQIKGADVRVVSNTPYQVRVSSQNNGKMKLGNSAINYQMRVNGSTTSVNSSAGTTIGQSSWPTPSAGDVYTLKFEILTDTTNLEGGVYQDVLTLTAIAN